MTSNRDVSILSLLEAVQRGFVRRRKKDRGPTVSDLRSVNKTAFNDNSTVATLDDENNSVTPLGLGQCLKQQSKCPVLFQI